MSARTYLVPISDPDRAHLGFCETCPSPDDDEGIYILREEIEAHQQEGWRVTLLRREVER